MSRLSLLLIAAPRILVCADQFCDKVPFLSTVSNTVDMVAKVVFRYIGTSPGLFGKSWSEHIAQKPLWKCVLLCVPLLGNIIVYFMPSRNFAQEVIDGLFDITNAYDRLPELKITSDDDANEPNLLTYPIMKGVFAEGMKFFAIKLNHDAEELKPDDIPADSTESEDRQLRFRYSDFETVYLIYQTDLDIPHLWKGHCDNRVHPCPFFFDASITDYEDGSLRGYEQEAYRLLRTIIQDGEGKDQNENLWKLVGHDTFKDDLLPVE
jgi:hypothetical protein